MNPADGNAEVTIGAAYSPASATVLVSEANPIRGRSFAFKSGPLVIGSTLQWERLNALRNDLDATNGVLNKPAEKGGSPCPLGVGHDDARQWANHIFRPLLYSSLQIFTFTAEMVLAWEDHLFYLKPDGVELAPRWGWAIGKNAERVKGALCLVYNSLSRDQTGRTELELAVQASSLGESCIHCATLRTKRPQGK